ncbi:hypothetical protein [Flavobacterium pedocola]
MVLLRKIKSATLIEALLATALIVVIFVVASLILNNLLFSTFSKNTHGVETRMNELEYQLQSGKLVVPFTEEYKDWHIEIKEDGNLSKGFFVFKAVNNITEKEVVKQSFYGEN